MTNFSFTVTLKPCMYRYEMDDQYDRTKNHLFVILKGISNNFTLVAECTKNCNVHYHGIVELSHKKHWYKVFRISDMFGFTQCREIYDMTNWVEYLKKSLDETSTSIERRPILNDNYNVFSLEDKMKYGTTY